MSYFLRPLKKPSISVLLGQFSLIAALLVGGLLSFMLMQKFMTLFDEQQNQDIKNNISIIKQNVFSQLDTYEAILRDKSNQPVLVHALMHPDDYAGAAKDFLDQAQIFGETEVIWLLDFEGKPVFEATRSHESFYGYEEWVETMLKGEIDSHQDLNAGRAGFFWRIAVPVIYQESPEGVLVLEMPVDRLLNEKVLSGLKGLALQINWDGEPAFATGDDKANTLWGSEKLLPSTSIDFFFDESIINKSKNKLLNEVLITAFMAVSVVIIVFVWLGKRWFVSPIKALSAVAHRVARGADVELNEQSKFAKEYTELFSDFRDMSEQIQEREKKLREQNEELEAAQKSLMESQSHLVQSEKMVSIGMVSAGVAHEINNPIGFVKSNLTTLNEYLEYLLPILSIIHKAKSDQELDVDSVKEQLTELVEKDDLGFVIEDIESLITDSVDGVSRVQEIVSGLKSFARTNESDDVLFDLNECIKSTLKVIWNEVKYKAKVDLDLKELPAVKGNPGQINQVVMNLIVNAAQAIENQGVINIQTEVSGDDVVMLVADNGKGMDAQVMHSIFDPFFTTKDVGQGTGLGLSISHGIVESHGGSIHVESQVGKGTVFTLRLPIPLQHVLEAEQVANG